MLELYTTVGKQGDFKYSQRLHALQATPQTMRFLQFSENSWIALMALLAFKKSAGG